MQAPLLEMRPLVVAAGEPAAAAGEFKAFHSAELRSLLHRLKRNELDMRSRLAKRVEALGGPGASISDPLYQRHHFAVEALEAQRARVERELSRRDVAGELTHAPIGRVLEDVRPVESSHDRVFASKAFTCALSGGRTSSSNHRLRFSQMLLRGLGWGRGTMSGQ